MGRSCLICAHPKRAEIDQALVDGVSFRNVTLRYGMSIATVSRHRAAHLPSVMAKGKEADEVAHADTLLAQIKDLKERALSILTKAEVAKSWSVALGAIREARQTLELLCKISGELDERPQVNILVSTAWINLRGEILQALSAFPEARAAVAKRLVEVKAYDSN